MSMSVSVSATLNRTAVERLLRLPGGLVDRNMRRRVERAAQVARRTAPGTMGRFIESSYGRVGQDPVGMITSRHPATVYVVNGTRPHIIRPVRAQALRFTVGGRTVYATVVHHPGTSPNHFLQQALRSAV